MVLYPCHVIRILIEAYDQDPDLSLDRCKSLVESTGLTRQQVFRWFKDRRRRGPIKKVIGLTKDQRTALRKALKTYGSRPSVEICHQLATQLALSTLQVQVWFNRRAQTKDANRNRLLNRATSSLPSPLSLPPLPSAFKQKDFEEQIRLLINASLVPASESHQNPVPSPEPENISGSKYFTSEQLDTMTRLFRHDSFPSHDEYVEVAKQTGLRLTQVKDWFKRKRHRMRQAKRSHTSEELTDNSDRDNTQAQLLVTTSNPSLSEITSDSSLVYLNPMSNFDPFQVPLVSIRVETKTIISTMMMTRPNEPANSMDHSQIQMRDIIDSAVRAAQVEHQRVMAQVSQSLHATANVVATVHQVAQQVNNHVIQQPTDSTNRYQTGHFDYSYSPY